MARAALAFEALLPPIWPLTVQGVPGLGGRARAERDLALTPATLRDLDEIEEAWSPLWGFGLRKALEPLPWDTGDAVIVAAGPGAPEAPSSLVRPISCGVKKPISLIVWGSAHRGPLCRAGTGAAVIESTTRRSKRIRDGKLAGRGPPLSSSSWAYLVNCTATRSTDSADDNVDGSTMFKDREALTCFEMQKTRPM